MKTNKTLILTGWGLPEYAAAAAVALRAFPDADLLGVSKRRLVETLQAHGKGREDVYVLGVSLRDNAADFAKIVKKLAENGTSVTWISSQELPEEAAEFHHCDELTLKIDTSVKTLTEAVGRFFEVDYEDLKPYGIKTTKVLTAVAKYQELFRAAGYAHRNRDDDQSYVLAIQSLRLPIKPEAWDPKLNAVIADFRKYGGRELIGNTRVLAEVRQQITIIAKHEKARVMILGENGTGKETVAQQIHFQSVRKDQPFVAFNCGCVEPKLLASCLFGHEKGSYTDAHEKTDGYFGAAKGGTLFLDEIGELPLEAQSLLLRVLQENKYHRFGGTEDIDADVRLITATNRDLAKMVREGAFRQDLYMRLNLCQIQMPSLRECKADIKPIAEDWWLRNRGEHLTDAQIGDLMDYDYPGNVRELLHILERAMIFEETDFKKVIETYKKQNAGLLAPRDPSEDKSDDYPENLDAMTRLHVKKVLGRYKTQKEAAKAMDISVNTLKRYL